MNKSSNDFVIVKGKGLHDFSVRPIVKENLPASNSNNSNKKA
tara:strand:+ start:730 stop:855 length:126 start_codon:yes stop_codon:yes gene_type:complete